jgi:xylan 1,4-beta-xylosidase
MGRPATPSREQIVALRKAGAASPAEHLTLQNGELSVTVPAQGLIVLEIGAARKPKR